MKYTKQHIPAQNQRQELNNQALESEDQQYIFDNFTGKGKLHGLDFNQFGSFHEYTDAKKAIENGAFFTPYEVAEKIIDTVDPEGTVLDPCCGASIFCNFIDEEEYTGIEIDPANAKVSKALYPRAEIIRDNIDYYNSDGRKWNNVITNPPFNLKWRSGYSQSMILRNNWIKKYGFFVMVVPYTYLSDEMQHKRDRKYIADNLHFIGQVDLQNNAFKSDYDITFRTKVLFFQNVPGEPYNDNFVTFDYIGAQILKLKEKTRSHKIEIAQEQIKSGSFKQGNFDFGYMSRKYLFEAKREGQKNYNKALNLLSEYQNQKKPQDLTSEEWNKTKLTEQKVIWRLKRLAGHKKTKRKKTARPVRQLQPFATEYPLSVDIFLEDFKFNNAHGTFSLNEIQKEDIAKSILKERSILNWEQGIGKTVAAYAVTQYRRARANIILAPALAIETTWKDHLDINGHSYKVVKSESDLDLSVDYLLITFTALDNRLSKKIRTLLRTISNNCQLIVDESDEICNRDSKRYKMARIAFARCRYKLLTTGTTTRNNITELYSQLELIYNNSLIDNCTHVYEYDPKSRDIHSIQNDNYGQPYDGKKGLLQFKRAFNPHRVSVLGIEKHDQDLYNYDELKQIIECTSIVRTFKEVVGDKYFITHKQVGSTEGERAIYKKVMEEFNAIVYSYYNNSGNSRKESALKIVRQLQLLIRACSNPTAFDPSVRSSKMITIGAQIRQRNEKVILGCLRKDTVDMYYNYLSNLGRPIWKITGDDSFKARREILAEFEATENGIIVCTQQSLKSSVNVPTCNLVMLESLHWNYPKMSQFFFRAIRFNSQDRTEVIFFTMENTIEDNLLNLIMNKEKVNRAVKLDQVEDVFSEYGFDSSILDSLITKTKDEEGRVQLTWSRQQERA